MSIETSNTYKFSDPSGLVVYVVHGVFSLRSIEGVNPIVEDQPCSRISIEVPDGCPLVIEEVYQALTGEVAGTDFKPKEGNRLLIGTVRGTSDQHRIIQYLQRSRVLDDATLDKVSDCCNNPNSAFPSPHKGRMF